jgi:hypothetical protein
MKRFMNKIKLQSAIELSINHMTQDENLHFAHVVSTLMEAFGCFPAITKLLMNFRLGLV